MKTCPNCGNELHDDSTFCFACMTAVNEREDIQIKLNSPYKKAIPVACIAVAIVAASSVFAVVSRKNNAVETKPPEPAQAVTTTSAVTTIPQTTPATTTTVPTTTTTAPAPSTDEIIKIAGGLRQASTGTAGTTTTTTTQPEETQPEENVVQQEEYTDTAEPEPSYYSEDGANELSRILVDKINKKRESKGYTPLRVCGQLDNLLSISIETLTHVGNEIDTWDEITLDKLNSNLNEVDLPSDSELILAGALEGNLKSYDEAFEFAQKEDLSCLLFTDDEGDLTVYSQRLDYKYLGCIIYDRGWRQQHPNGDVSYTPQYRCEIWLMK